MEKVHKNERKNKKEKGILTIKTAAFFDPLCFEAERILPSAGMAAYKRDNGDVVDREE